MARLGWTGVALCIASTLGTVRPGWADDALEQVRAELAPQGKIRVALPTNSPAWATKDPPTGELHGVGIDLARDLAARLGLPLEALTYPNPQALVASIGSGAWDLILIARDPEREKVLAYAADFGVSEMTYLVPSGSPLGTAADVDRPGIRVAVLRHSVQDLILGRALRRAEIVRIDGATTDGVAAIRQGRADAFADGRGILVDEAERWPGSRVLPGRFAAVELTFAMSPGHPAALAYVHRFIEEAKSSGAVQRLIDRYHLAARLSAAPPASLDGETESGSKP